MQWIESKYFSYCKTSGNLSAATNHAMNKQIILQSFGIAALFALFLTATMEMNINLPLVGVAVAFLGAGLLWALAATEPSKSNS